MTTAEIDPDVTAAEVAADEADSLVTAIEDRIMAGDESATHDELSNQISLARFARKFVEGAKTKSRLARANRRLIAAEALRSEIDDYAFGIGKRLAKLLRAVDTAERAFKTCTDEHNAKYSEWHSRMVELDIPQSDGRPVPPAEDGRLALADILAGGIFAGRRRLDVIWAEGYLKSLHEGTDVDAIATALEQIDMESPEPTAQFFYAGSGGSVFGYDVDKTLEEIKIGQLTKITRKEAWGE